MRSILVLLMLTLATPAHAVDGVLEINQACAVQTGCFAGDGPGFPVTISQAGSYRLTGALSQTYVAGISTPVDAIRISGDGVHLDLGGFTISCENPFGDCGGNADGIAFSGVGIDGARITHGVIRDWPGDGVSLNNSTGTFLGDLHVIGNGGYGIRAGQGATVTDCTIVQNTNRGISAGVGSRISGNTVFSNQSDGISVTDGSLVESNAISFNSGFGLDIDFGAAYRGNVFDGNVAGTVTGTGVGGNVGANLCNGTTTCP
jgi:hypothetical protein